MMVLILSEQIQNKFNLNNILLKGLYLHIRKLCLLYTKHDHNFIFSYFACSQVCMTKQKQ